MGKPSDGMKVNGSPPGSPIWTTQARPRLSFRAPGDAPFLVTMPFEPPPRHEERAVASTLLADDRGLKHATHETLGVTRRDCSRTRAVTVPPPARRRVDDQSHS